MKRLALLLICGGLWAGCVVPLDGATSDVLLLRAVVFNAVLPYDQYHYSYNATVGKPFDLVLEVNGAVKSLPDGIGAALVLGLPQGGLEEVFQAVGSAAGTVAQQRIATQTDTSGQNAPRGGGTVTVLPVNPFRGLFGGLCGTLGGESLVMGLGAAGWYAGRRRRRRA